VPTYQPRPRLLRDFQSLAAERATAWEKALDGFMTDRRAKWSWRARRASWQVDRLLRRLRPFDEEAIYREVGRYVVIFQQIEQELLQICWLLAEPAYDSAARVKLTRMPFKQLVSETSKRIDAFRDERGLDDTEFRRAFWTRFHDLLAHCREIADQRNSIVHSAYVHLEAGDELHGIVRSDMRAMPDASDVEFDHENLSAHSFYRAMQDMAWTIWHLGQCRIQLIHWRDRPRRDAGPRATGN
jgi:hypothetical protein